MNLDDFSYELPAHFIAQEPVEPRDASRLIVLDSAHDEIVHATFRDLPQYLRPGDVLVMNTTRVIPARIPAMRADTGGKLEILLLRKLDERRWRVLIGGKRARAGTKIAFPAHQVDAEVTEELADSERIVRFSEPIELYLDALGQMPLPPYINANLKDSERYQTIYSREQGSAAAPTAGLHFTPELLLTLRENGIQFAYCELRIGLDTFQPVHEQNIADHHMHSEWARLTAENANIINSAKLAGSRIIAVGTTSARTLETAGILSEGGDPSNPDATVDTCPWRPVIAFERDTDLFIYPGYRWRVVDAMITNFHLPKSTLLMMISSFAGRERVLSAYETAKTEGYRFFSFGDAMFIR